MAPDGDDETQGLHSLGGEHAPADVELGLRDLLLLPDGAKRNFWEALGPSLQHPLPADLDDKLQAFQRKHEAPAAKLAHALKACRVLLREAGIRNIDAAAFNEDLRRISDPPEALGEIIMPGFDRAMAAVRNEILYGTLIDHGKLLTGVDWRVDSMMMSHRGEELQSPVALVTLRFMEGREERRITVQALPDMLSQLQRMCEQILKS